MKTTKIISLLLVIALVSGCKRDGWLDWQVQNQLWLQDNAKKEGVVTTPTGLQYKCIDAGPFAENPTAVRPDESKTVIIDYEGRFINGYVFDSAKYAELLVSGVVSGFAEGLKKMHQFGTYELYIPYDLGYGINGNGTEGNSSFIPPYSTLIFHVYLRDIY